MKNEASVIISSNTFWKHTDEKLILAIYFHHASNEELNI